MDLGRLISLGLATAQDAWSWALILAMMAKVGSTLALLGMKAGRPWRWVATHERSLWWTTKLSALALCFCAAALCRLGGDMAGEIFFVGLLTVAAILATVRVARRRALASTTGR